MKKLFRIFKSFRIQLQASVISVLLIIFVLVFAALYTTLMGAVTDRMAITSGGYFKQMDYVTGAFQKNIDNCMTTVINISDIKTLFEQMNTRTEFDEWMLRIQIINSLNKAWSIYGKDYESSDPNNNGIIRSICLMDDNGNVIIMSSRYIYCKVNEKDPTVYDSEFLQDLRAQKNNKSKWTLGDNASFFKDATSQDTWKSAKIVSVYQYFSGVKNPYYVILNIDETEISALYRNMQIYDTARSYIVDGSGKILSSPDTNRRAIGAQSALAAADFAKDSGSTMHKEIGSTIYLYHSLPIAGWYSVLEIPKSDYAKELTYVQSVLVLFFLIGIVLSIAVISILMQRLTKPILTLKHAMGRLGEGDVGYQIMQKPGNELGQLADQFNKISGELKALMDENRRIEKQKRDFELEMLRAQINPHFIYNSMNMIKWMARIQKSESIEDALTRLENMLHPLFSNDQPFCTLEEELKYCSDFISLSNLRYGGAIRLNIKVKKTLKAFYIFRLLLQPIIENAVVHGFIEKTGKCVVAILCEELEDALMIHVCDNGQGMPEGMLGELQASLRKGTMSEAEADDRTKHGSFIGLRNVNGRIKSCFGAQYGLNVESKPGHGTKVCVLVPKITRENMKNF